MSEIEKDLAELLREHRGGVVLRDASRQFGELLDAVMDLGLAGSLTMKVGVKLVDEDSGELAVTVDVTPNIPRPKAGSATFYARHGTLVPFEEPVAADAEPTRSPETQAAMAVHGSSDEEDRRQARSVS